MGETAATATQTDALTDALTTLLREALEIDPVRFGVGAGELIRGRMFSVLRGAAGAPANDEERIVRAALVADVVQTMTVANGVAHNAWLELERACDRTCDV